MKRKYKYRPIDYIKAYHYFGWKRKRAAMIVNRARWAGEPIRDDLVREAR